MEDSLNIAEDRISWSSVLSLPAARILLDPPVFRAYDLFIVIDKLKRLTSNLRRPV